MPPMAPPLSAVTFAVDSSQPPGSARRWGEVQPEDRDIPTLATEGIDLRGVTSFYVAALAETGETFTGGSLLAWRYDTGTARWCRAETWDLSLADAAGEGAYSFPEKEVHVSSGRLLYASVDMLLSDGDGTVCIIAHVGRV